jgi:hypothetical protein
MYDLPLNVLCKVCETYGRPTRDQRADKSPYNCHRCGASSRPFSPKLQKPKPAPQPD